MVSFRREKFAPKGGPDGGDGGDGGHVILVASGRRTSLLAVGRRPLYRAEDGRPGGPRKRSGRGGADCVIEVPVGTQIFDRERGHLLRDLAAAEERVVIAEGGRGGRGNASFVTSVRQTPRRAEPGRPGEHRLLSLQLKLFAEVGLVGLPNAGKSTFLSVVSKATPKIADYPFTTLEPQVGIAQIDQADTLVVADLPGLIEGAAQGVGLGHRFLKHVERCRVLLHMIDVSDGASAEPERAAEVLGAELEGYSPELARRPRILVATKCEGEAARARADELEERLGVAVQRISSLGGDGVQALLRAAWRTVHGPEKND